MVTVFADDYGFNPEDATNALQSAINDETADKIIVENKGTPWIISEQINLKDNKEIVFEPGVVVRAKPGSLLDQNDSLFDATNVDNVKFIGQGEGENRPILKMNREEYDAKDGQTIIDENGEEKIFDAQFNHVIDLLGVDGYRVSGLTLTGGGGDGIHIAGGSFQSPPEPNSGILPYSRDGVIENVISDNNRRQGLSIDSANILTVRDSTFSNTGGETFEEPEAGIDLEPTWDFESLQDIIIENVTIDNNKGNGIQFTLGNLDDNSEDISVDIRNNINIKNINPNSSAIFVSGTYIYPRPETAEADFKGEPNRNSPESRIDGTINIEDVNISNAESIANISNPEDNTRNYIFIQDIPGSRNDPDNLQVNFNNIRINDPTDKNVETNPIYINGSKDNPPPEIGNLSFNDVSIVGNYSLPIVLAELENENSRFKNISGNITVANSGNGETSVVDRNPSPENFSLTVTDGNVNPVAPITGNIELTNPGFQDGLDGWNGRSDNISVVERFNGNSWVRLAPSFTGGIAQDITGKITPGESYRISATAQVEDLGTYAAIGINYKNEANELQQVQNIDIVSDTPQTWELGFTVPDNFATAEIFAYKQEGSALFVDDFSLTAQL